ncbi:hypothetical protein AAW14_24265 [Streptomyces hygroscopicus]|nr:hypothetical protein [Streptomyces hygroscopicus]
MAESVHQLIGMAPFQGISVGVDRKSPVSWPLYARHGVFRYTGTLRSVRRDAGERAESQRGAKSRPVFCRAYRATFVPSVIPASSADRV